MNNTWRKTASLTSIICAIIIVFPPFGYGGGTIHRFAFIFSDVPYASIVWELLAAEIAIILFFGLAVGFFLNSRD